MKYFYGAENSFIDTIHAKFPPRGFRIIYFSDWNQTLYNLASHPRLLNNMNILLNFVDESILTFHCGWNE